MKTKLLAILFILTASLALGQRSTRFGLEAGVHYIPGTSDGYDTPRGLYSYGHQSTLNPNLGVTWQRDLNSWLSLNWGVSYANYVDKSYSTFESNGSDPDINNFDRNEKVRSHFIEVPVSLSASVPVLKQRLFAGLGVKPIFGFASRYSFDFVEGEGSGQIREDGVIPASFADGLGYVVDNLGMFLMADVGTRLKGGWEFLLRKSVGTTIPSHWTCPPGAICMQILYRRLAIDGYSFVLRKYF